MFINFEFPYSALSGNHAYVKTLYDAWIPEFGSGSGMDPDPAGFRVVGSGSDPDPARTKMSRSGLDPDPAGSENCGFGAPLTFTLYYINNLPASYLKPVVHLC